MSSSPALARKVRWVILGQSLFLSPTHNTGLLLWGKQEEESVLDMFATLLFISYL